MHTCEKVLVVQLIVSMRVAFYGTSLYYFSANQIYSCCPISLYYFSADQIYSCKRLCSVETEQSIRKPRGFVELM